MANRREELTDLAFWCRGMAQTVQELADDYDDSGKPEEVAQKYWGQAFAYRDVANEIERRLAGG